MYTVRKKLYATRDRKLRRDWWDKLYTRHPRILAHGNPPHGWIHEARFCLFMSLSDIATRLGKSRSCIAHYERDEKSGGISLRTLRTVANAMNCDFAYYFVPKTNNSFEELLKEQRRKKPNITHNAAQNLWKAKL